MVTTLFTKILINYDALEQFCDVGEFITIVSHKA